MIEDVLKQIGLKDKEIQIYLALLPLGNAPASILGKHANIKRSMAQYICHKLEKMGLIKSVFKKNAYYYTPESPDKLEDLLDNEIRKINNTKDEFRRIYTELEGLINPHTVLPKVRFYEGVDGLISLFSDEWNLTENDTMYGIHRFYEHAPKELLDYIYNEYDVKRKKVNYKSYAIWNDNPASLKRKELDKDLNRISLFIPEKDFPLESSFQIYRNKIAFYSYHLSDITGVIIENEHMKTTMLSTFKLAWNYARKLKLNSEFKNVEIE